MSKNNTLTLLPTKYKVVRRVQTKGIPRAFLNGNCIFTLNDDPDIAYGIKKIPYKINLRTGESSFLSYGDKDHHKISNGGHPDTLDIDVLVLKDGTPHKPTHLIS